jgi:hypothetical protein
VPAFFKDRMKLSHGSSALLFLLALSLVAVCVPFGSPGCSSRGTAATEAADDAAYDLDAGFQYVIVNVVVLDAAHMTEARPGAALLGDAAHGSGEVSYCQARRGNV